MPRHSRRVYRRRRFTVFSLAFVLLAGGTYVPFTLLSPLPETAPVVVQPALAANERAEIILPEYGASAIAARGFGELEHRGSSEALPMASITKVITALVVLDAHPLSSDDAGAAVTMTNADVDIYWRHIARNGSTVQVRAGLVLTERELLELTLMASANNYSETLAYWAFGNLAAFVQAARNFLDSHGLSGITVVEPSGLDPANTASASDLLRLGELALDQPIVAEIVSQQSAWITEIGEIGNSNLLLGEGGVDGIKTGTLDEFGSNLLFSADFTLGVHQLRLIGVVLGGPDRATINEDIRRMIRQTIEGFHEISLVGAGETFANYLTVWGQELSANTTEAATVLVWSDTAVTSRADVSTITLGESGQQVGQLVFTVDGQDTVVPLALTARIKDPGVWWRLTHPAVFLTS